MTPSANYEAINALIRLRDGSLTCHDMMLAESQAMGWGEGFPLMNAKPDRWKLCPRCMTSLPIDDFIIPSDSLRTAYKIDRMGNQVAIPVADVAERCVTCRR